MRTILCQNAQLNGPEIDPVTVKKAKKDFQGLFVINPLNGEMIAWDGDEHRKLRRQMSIIPNDLEPFCYELREKAFKKYKRSFDITHPNRSQIDEFLYYA